MNLRKITFEGLIEIPIIGMFIVFFSNDSVSINILTASVSGNGLEPVSQVPTVLYSAFIVALMFVFLVVLFTSVTEFVYDTYENVTS
jgi:hypothetical protein